MGIRIIRPGMYASVQDLGRPGYQRFGVPVSGCMDRNAAATANLLVGNAPADALLEFCMHGAEMQVLDNMLISFSGGGCQPEINGTAMKMDRAVYTPKNSVIRLRYDDVGCYTYMAVAGGIAVEPVLGSCSAYDPVAAHYQLKGSEELPTGVQGELHQRISGSLQSAEAKVAKWGPIRLTEGEQGSLIRVLRGPEWDQLPYRDILNGQYVVSQRTDRMGMMLEWADQHRTIKFNQAKEMLSTAVTRGTIQVLPSGLPMILMADAQTTGGYPRLAQVIAADLGQLSQMRPGHLLRFREVSVQVAIELMQSQQQELKELAKSIRTKFAV